MPKMFQQLQFPIRPLAQDGSREWLHDLLDGDGGTTQLVFSGADGGKEEEMNQLLGWNAR